MSSANLWQDCLPFLILHSNVRLMLIRERESLLFQDPPGPLVYNVNMVCRASHQSLLIFNVHYISLVNVRPRVGLPSRLSVSFILSSLHIKIGSTNPVFSTPTPLFMVNFKWNEEKSLQQSSFCSAHIYSYLGI